MKKSLSVFWGLMTSAGAFAAPVTVSSTCMVEQSEMESSEVGGTVLDVSGPLRFTADGPCEVRWTATRQVTLPAGTYVVGHTFDFTYEISTFGPGLLNMNMNSILSHPVHGEVGGLATGTGVSSNGSGSFFYSVDTGDLGVYYALEADTYVLTQHMWIDITAEPESIDPFLMTAVLHFPQLSFVTQRAAVPEPSTFVLGAAAGLMLWWRKRR